MCLCITTGTGARGGLGRTDGSHVPVHYHWDGSKGSPTQGLSLLGEALGGTDSSRVPVRVAPNMQHLPYIQLSTFTSTSSHTCHFLH